MARERYTGRGGSLHRDDDGHRPHWQDHCDERDMREFTTAQERLPVDERPYVPVVDRDTGEVAP